MRTAYIGMGGNLPSRAGPPEATLAAAVERLGKLGQVTARSRLYSTAPVGMAEQPRFLNAVVALETRLSPRMLLEGLMEVEKEFGRDRSAGIVNGPRTLDLDLLLLGDLMVAEHNVEIPHPRLAERAFVLIPLYEVAPEARDPRSGRSVSQLLMSLAPGPDDPTHAVLPYQSDLWRPGAVAVDKRGRARTGDRDRRK